MVFDREYRENAESLNKIITTIEDSFDHPKITPLADSQFSDAIVAVAHNEQKYIIYALHNED